MPLFPPGFALGVGWVGFVVYDCIFRLWETPISEARSGAPSFVIDFGPAPPGKTGGGCVICVCIPFIMSELAEIWVYIWRT